jgi:hypothetical protein
MNNLKIALDRQGKYKASEKMQQQLAVVLDSQKNSRPPHPPLRCFVALYIIY